MRLIVHDFGGYAFPIQLSRELANRGHDITHVIAAGLGGRKGNQIENQDGFTLIPISLASYFKKYSPLRRLVAHRHYAAKLAQVIVQKQPDLVLSGNSPIDVQYQLLGVCHRKGIGFVHWVQDMYSPALDFVLRRRVGFLATAIVSPFRLMEAWIVRNSELVIAISPGFIPQLSRWGASPDSLVVIENWAPLTEVIPMPRRNSWSESFEFNDLPVFLYAGTLGLKHRPDLIYCLAEALQGQAEVVVVTEGAGREYLANRPSLSNLRLLDFQPYDRLSEMLGSADVLLASLEREAGTFAVPSKVLTYLCAARPVLLTAPSQNMAAEVVRRSGAGVVVDPDDTNIWMATARRLANDAAWRAELGARARQYAEANFDIQTIADRFEAVLHNGMERRVYLSSQ